MVGRSTRSLDVIAEEVRAEREIQLRHVDALDSKAGIVLGFAGAIVALAPGGHHLFVELGRGTAALSGLFALWSFWPRRYWDVDLRSLREAYLAADPMFTLLRLVDTQIVTLEDLRGALARKANRLKASMAGLATAAVLTATGLALRHKEKR